MHLGLIHTYASLADLHAALTAMRATWIKAVPAWWPHGPAALAALPQRKIVRTSWGDPSYANGARAYPEWGGILIELAPYLAACPDAAIEFGNEPSGHGLDLARYARELERTLAHAQAAWPRALLLPPAHSPHAADRVAWHQTLGPIARQCAALTIHGYSDAEVRDELRLVRQHVSGTMPVWLTEVNYGQAMPDADRARGLRALLSNLPGVEVALLYHLDTHPAPPLEQQGGAHYRLTLDTLRALGEESAMAINWVGMSRPHYTTGRTMPIRAVVIHATAGRFPSDLNWLRQGGDSSNPVSAHYYIDKRGAVSQLVQVTDTAWHAGTSQWVIDGKTVLSLNATSIGIELENLNTGRDPYPEAQLAAAAALTRDLAQRYRIPRSQLVRHLDISPGRKSDPAGLDWPAFVERVYGDPWAAWGSVFPLAPEQRGFAIPKRWLADGGLGAAIGFEQALGLQRAAQAFERGVIVWLGGDTTAVVREGG